jgi:phosphate transport system substrate-binding protein
MFAKIARLVALVGIASIALTACTPPMPPEVKAALLEQTYTCIDGSANVQSPATVSGDLPNIQQALSGNCQGMTLNTVAAGTATDLYIGADAPAAADCKVDTSVPYALNAAVVAATLSTASGAVFSPETVAGIFDGSIKNWDDKRITKDNAGTPIGSGPIQVFGTTDKRAAAAFGAWYKEITGKPFQAPLLKAKADLSVEDLGTLADGSVALLPYDVFSVYSVTATTIPLAAAIVSDAKLNPAGAVPDVQGIASAGTQFQYKKSGSVVSLQMNYNAKPIPPQGSDVAPAPYGAVYPVDLSICGKPTKVMRAIGRYLLRQDAQGMLTTLAPLPEILRAESLDVVSVGLPEPKVTAPAN